jgi:hypothetical protein
VRDVEVDSLVLCGAGFQPAAGLQPAFAALAGARGRPVGNRPQVENLPHIAASRNQVLSPGMAVDMPAGGLTTRRRLTTCPTKIVAAREELDE